MELTHLSLFSGIGGIDLAAHWAGFKTVQFVEIDPFCQKVLAKNFPGVPIHGDIHTFDGHALDDATLLTGGFPCQPWSFAGKQREEDDPRHLWPDMLRVIRECRPSYVIAENVRGFLARGHEGLCVALEGAGYKVGTVVFPAGAVGARHLRERVFVVAHSGRARLEGVHAAGNREYLQLPALALSRHDWSPAPRVLRAGHGIPNGLDRLRALGNAVVPQQVYPLLAAIARWERGDI